MYFWVKAFHIIFMVAWMAGLLVYPRYKVHQLSAKPGETLFETMKEASARLKRVILTPSMILVWVLGITMLVMNQSLLSQTWMWLKLALVFGLTGIHGYLSALGCKIDNAEPSLSGGALRVFNELPFVLLIVIVILVVVKPF